jgi:hypothetical protein
MQNNSIDDNEIEEIVTELKENSNNFPKKSEVDIPKITDENVGDYIYQKSAEMLELTMDAIKSMQQLLQTAADPKEVSAYAQLMSTAFKGIDNLNKINIQQKQAKNNIEVKKIESDAKNKFNPLLPSASGQQTNNFFIGSRDEAMQLLKNKPKKIELVENSDIIEQTEE